MTPSFICLTFTKGQSVWVNMNCIAEITVNDGDTILAESAGFAVWRVKETPEEIFEKIRQLNP